MRRAGKLLDAIAEPNNLRLAFLKAARGKSGKAEVVSYRMDLAVNLADMRKAVLDGSVDVGCYHFFKVHDPKERNICAAAFPERVLHHALMNVCEPIFERRLIHDTYACRVGKGRNAALARAQGFSRKYDWFLKLDIRSYFDSISHTTLLALLRRVIKDVALLAILERLIASYETSPGRGLPIGNLTSQHLANLYLGELDHFVKEGLCLNGYVRYMDDFVLWGDSRRQMVDIWGRVTAFLADQLMLCAKPPQLNRATFGMPFLGVRLWPEKMVLDRRGRRRFSRKMLALEAAYFAGMIDSRTLQTRATALVAHTEASGGRTFRRAWLAIHDFGAAAMDASGSNRVIRGGSWNNNASNCRSANRNNNSPTNTNNNNGFRTVRSSEGSPQWEIDSDPAAVPSAPAIRGRQILNAHSGLVGQANTVPSALGGHLFSSRH